MKKGSLKKLGISFLTAICLSSALPWNFMLAVAETIKVEESTGTSKPLPAGEKVKLEDLPEAIQEKLSETEKKEITKEEKDGSTNETVNEILSTFQVDEKTALEEVVTQAIQNKMEEKVSERTEYSKTFLNPMTGLGQSYLFTVPIHQKDKEGHWQDFSPKVTEKKEAIVLENQLATRVPKRLDKDHPLEVTSDKSQLKLSISDKSLAIDSVNDNKVLLSSSDKSSFAEVKNSEGSVTLSEFVTEDSLKLPVKIQLSLGKDEKAQVSKGNKGIEILKNEKLTSVISAPLLESLKGEVLTEVPFKLDEKTNEVVVESLPKDVLMTVKSAKLTLGARLVDKEIYGVETTSIRQYDNTMSYYFQNYMMVGYDNGYFSGDLGAGHFTTYGLAKVPNEQFLQIAQNHEIMTASLRMKRIGAKGFWGDAAKDGNGNPVTRVYEVSAITQDIGPLRNISYDTFISKMGSPYGPPVNDDGKEVKVAGLDENNRWVDFDITYAANDWKNGQPNYGLFIKNTKNSAHEMPYSQAELFGGLGRPDAEPYVVLSHREKPAIDKNMPLGDTTLSLRPFVSSNNDGLVQFRALGMDGKGRMDATINYRVIDKSDKDKVIFEGVDPAIGRDYLYPDYPDVGTDTQKYVDKQSNWQTSALLTSVLKEDRLYQTTATIRFDLYGKNEKADKSYDSFQLYKVKQQDSLARVLAFYGLSDKRASFMRDNNMKDELLTAGNVIFIRHPQKNAGQAYNPAPLEKADKIRLDSLAMGRGKHCEFGFEPINLGSGNFLYDTTDGQWVDFGEKQAIKRTYNAMGKGVDSAFGTNWTFNLDLNLSPLDDKSMMLTKEDGGKVFFQRNVDGSYSVEDNEAYRLTQTSEVVEEVTKRLFVMEDTKNQLTYRFDASGQIRSIQNQFGQEKTYSYDEKTGFLKEIKAFNAQTITFTWDENAHITSISYPNKSKTSYSYDKNNNLIKVVDQTGHAFSYKYDDKHRMTSYQGADGKDIYQNVYDEKDRVIKQTDGEGNVTKLAYDKHTTTTTDGNGNQTITTFNDHFQPTKVVYPDGKTETKTYDKAYQLIETTDRKGQKTSYSYDAQGNVTSRTYPDGTKEATTYTATAKPVTETTREGKTKSYTYDEKGNLTSFTDEAGNQSTFENNALGQKVKATNPLGQTTNYSYDAAGHLTSESDALGLVRSYAYDLMGDVTVETDGLGKEKTYSRNARGELVKETNFNGNEKTYSYDAEGNKTSETDYNGNKRTYVYNSIGKLIKETNALGASRSYTYDANGNQITETDYLGHLKKTKYNALNQKIETLFADDTKATYEYDALGNLTKEILPGGANKTYSYDINNFLTKEKNAKNEATIYERNLAGQPTTITYPDETSESFVYDSLGNLIEETGKNGRVTKYSYNATNEVIQSTSLDRTEKQNFDARGNRIESKNALDESETYHFNAAGFITESIAADGSLTSYENDGEGHPIKVTDAKGAVYQYAYDGMGNKIKEIDPKGNETKYSYNALNLLETKVSATGDIEQYAYDKNGRVNKKIDPMGNVTCYTYSLAGEIQTLTNALGERSSFSYDEASNVTTFTDTIGRVTQYDYNLLNQLTKETRPNGVITSYSYDKSGNLRKVTDSTGQEESYSYDPLGQLLSVTDKAGRTNSQAYNAFGEIISQTDVAGNTTTFELDTLGRQLQVNSPRGTSESKSYNNRGQVVEKVHETGAKTTYTYDVVGNLIQEINANNQSKTYNYDNNGQLTSLTDENGGKTQFSYDALGRVVESIDAKGNVAKQSYDGNGNLTKATDAEGNSTTYAYNALNQVVETVDAKGFKATIAYDKAGRKVKESDRKGNFTTYTYDAMDNILSTTDPLKRTANFSYDKRNQLLESQDFAGVKTTFSYNEDGSLKSEINGKGYEKSYSYDKLSQLSKVTDNVHEKPLKELTYNKFGQVTKEVQSGKLTTSYSYDKFGRLTGLSYPDESKVSYSYDALNRLEKLVDKRGNATTLKYDSLGNVTELVAPNGAVTSYTYDANNNLLKEVDPLNFATEFAYNKNNQNSQIKDANGGITKQSFDSRNQKQSITNARGKTQSFDYDGNGNILKQTDARGNSKTFSYDAANRLSSVTNRLGKSTRYHYDRQDHLTEITDANNSLTTLTYTPTGELETLTTHSGRTEKFTYSLDGKLLQNTKANGENISYVYNDLNQQVAKLTKQASYSYEYNVRGQVTKAETKSKIDLGESELPAEVQDKLPQSNSLTLTYNQYGDLTKSTGTDGKAITYAYDAFGRKTEVKYSNGTSLKYEYDQKNQLTKVIDKFQATTYSYDGLGNITEIAFADGTTSTYQYSPSGEVEVAKTTDKKGKTLSQQAYAYDDNGNMISEKLLYPKLTIERTYAYDKENQLVKLTEKERNTTRVTDYLYDNVGNRLAVKTAVNGTSKGYQEWTNNSDNQLTDITGEQGASYSYDRNGHVSQKQSVTGEVISYTYNTEGQLIQEVSNWGATTNYYYDALGNRIAKASVKDTPRKLKTKLKAWMKGVDRTSLLSLEAEDVTLEDALSATGYKETYAKLSTKNKTWVKDHEATRRQVIESKLKAGLDDKDMTLQSLMYLNDYSQEYVSPLQVECTTVNKKKVKTVQSTFSYDSYGTAIGDEIDFFHQDGKGSNITQSRREDGGLETNNLYEVYGRSERPIYDTMGYRSQYHEDWQTQNLRAREYDTTTGRFLQEDSYLGRQKDPTSQNRYIYGNNNPNMYRDDSGHKSLWENIKSAASWVNNNVIQPVYKNVIQPAVSWVNQKLVQPVAKVVNQYIVQPAVNAFKVVSNFVGNVTSAVVNTVQQAAARAQAFYNDVKEKTSNALRTLQSEVEKLGAKFNLTLPSKLEDLLRLYDNIKSAQATRVAAEARVRKMCEAAGSILPVNASSNNTEFGTIKLKSDKNSPVKISINGKSVTIDVYAEFKGNTKGKVGGSRYKELVKQGIKAWGGNYTNVFGEDISVNVNVKEGKNYSWWELWKYNSQKYLPININQGKGVSHTSFNLNEFYYGEINMYPQDSRNNASPYDKKDYAATVTHEFGHILGLDDAYAEEGGNRPAAPTSIYEEDGIMRYQFDGINISNKDIEMVLLASRDKENQYFVDYDNNKQSEVFK